MRPAKIRRLVKRGDVGGLAKGLRGGDKSRRRAAVALGDVGDASAVVPLDHALQLGVFVSVDVRGRLLEAIDALARIGGPEATRALAAALERHPGGETAQAAADGCAIVAALARIGDAGAGSALERALDPIQGHEVQLASIAALGAMGDPAAIFALEGTLGDPALRDAATGALCAIGGPAAVATLARDFERFCVAERTGGAFGGADALVADEILVNALASDKPIIRSGAAGQLRHRTAIGAIRPLLEIVARDDEQKVREDALRAFSCRGTAKLAKVAAQSLATALDDPDVRIRMAAVLALNEAGPLGVGIVMCALADPDEDVRSLAVLTVGLSEGAMSEPDVVAALHQAARDESVVVREAAEGVLALVPQLVRQVRMRRVIGERAYRDTDQTSSIYNTQERLDAAAVLARLRPPKALPALADFLRDHLPSWINQDGVFAEARVRLVHKVFNSGPFVGDTWRDHVRETVWGYSAFGFWESNQQLVQVAEAVVGMGGRRALDDVTGACPEPLRDRIRRGLTNHGV